MINKFLVLHDSDQKLRDRGAFEVKKSELRDYNKRGYGCFFQPNLFEGGMKTENLVKIQYWIADIDNDTENSYPKEAQQIKINALPIKPTIIVETKKGYHLYFKAINATIDNYKSIELGLIEALNADKACKNVNRLLRLPNYFHMKTPDNPYMVKVIFDSGKEYTEQEMLSAYKLPEKKKPKYQHNFTKTGVGEKDWWFDRAERNRRLKSHEIVNGTIDNTMRQYFLWARDEVGEANAIKIMQELNQDIAEPMKQHDFDRVTRR